VWSRPWPWIALVAALFAIPFARSIARARHRQLPVLWQLPAWELSDQNGRPFGARELRGTIYVASFIFTSCVSECPRMTREMAHLEPEMARYHGRVHMVSISVDPAHDTPDRLREYMARYHADPALWTFVTGPEQAVLRAVGDGFRIDVELPRRGPNGDYDPVQLAHANRFALVDGQGRLRGSYRADDEGEQNLAADLARLAEAP
jgi:protein SCO1/2